MPRHALVLMLAMSLVSGLASPPAASLADDIKPKAPETAFSGKLRPEILGISTELNAESARAIFDSLFKGRTDTKTDIQQQKFGGASYVAALNFSLPAGSKQNGEMLSTSFSSPASANRAYFVARNLTFAQDQQPSKADMIKEVMGKYGVPTIVGDQHLYYITARARSCPSAASTRKRLRWKRSTSRLTQGCRQAQRRYRPRQLRGRRQARADQG